MKKLNKTCFAILLLLIVLCSNVFAVTVSSEKATLEIVENNICTINITDSAIFEKKIVDYNLDKKEITIGLKVSNNATAPLDKPSEIILVIDDSKSMKHPISTDTTRMKSVINSAKTLATELLKLNTVKLGVVSFSTGSNEGTITDATLQTGITTSKDTVLNSIEKIYTDFLYRIEHNDPTSSVGIRTDIEAGITLAGQQFSGTCENKFIVLLTDGVPDISLGSNKILYSGITATNTINALKRLDSSGVQILSMMTGVTNEVESWQTGKTFKELAEEVFGTPKNPTVGKFYYITDNEIEKTVCETIFNQLVAPQDNILTDIDIYDYFPQEIVDNFNFEYVTLPTLGTVSEDIDLQNNMIVWHIDRLSYGESDMLSYKLTLKDNIDEKIIDVILNTNEKVDITTEKILNDDGSKKIITSDITPKVKVSLSTKEPDQEFPDKEPPAKNPDDTTAKEPIPQTGTTITFHLTLGIILIFCILISIRLYFKNK